LGLRRAATAFLPAYVLIHILARLTEPTSDSQDHPPSPWLHAFSWAAACGFPLLPGYFLTAQLYGAAYNTRLGVWALVLVTTLLIAASGMRAIKEIRFKEKTDAPFGNGSLILLALLVLVLGLLNLFSASPLETFLEPIFGSGWSISGWWGFGMAVLIAALGAALGYALEAWLKGPTPQFVSWITRGYDIQMIYERVVARPLQAASTFLAQTVEPLVERWTFGGLGRLISRPSPQDRDPPPFVPTSLILFVLGIAAVAVALLVR
jgi:uncharacterized membrane protein